MKQTSRLESTVLLLGSSNSILEKILDTSVAANVSLGARTYRIEGNTYSVRAPIEAGEVYDVEGLFSSLIAIVGNRKQAVAHVGPTALTDCVIFVGVLEVKDFLEDGQLRELITAVKNGSESSNIQIVVAMNGNIGDCVEVVSYFQSVLTPALYEEDTILLF